MNIEFEEIEGKRYAKWTEQNKPFGTRNAFAWREFAGFLAGVAVFWIVQGLSAVLVAFGGWSFAGGMGLIVATLFLLLAVGFRWALRERRRKRTASFEEWRKKEPDLTGVPCSMALTVAITTFVDSGLLSVDGNMLLFRGPRFRAAFPIGDLPAGVLKPTMRFAYQTPFGKRRATLVLGGPSDGGWVTKKDALEILRSAGGTPGDAGETGEAVYPPLRYPSVAFEEGFLTKTVPLMLAAYLAISLAFGIVPIEAMRSSFGRPTESPWTYFRFLVAIYACYGLVVGAGYGVRRMMHSRNRKIDALVAAERVLG